MILSMLSLYGSHSSSDQGWRSTLIALSPTPSSSCSLEARLKLEHVASIWLFASKISKISGSYVNEQTVDTKPTSSEMGELP